MSKRKQAFNIDRIAHKVARQMVLLTTTFTMEELSRRSKQKNISVEKLVAQMVENQIALEVLLENGEITIDTGIEEVIEFLKGQNVPTRYTRAV